jgi:phosphohistidine phosphatase
MQSNTTHSTRAFFSGHYLLSVSGIMKTLFLLRHAKSENAAPGLTDLNRSLNERGRKEAQALGQYIKKENIRFDLVLCSTAVRARETTELVLASAELTSNVRDDQRIYEAGALRLLEVISESEQSAKAVLVVGHNPALEELIQLLTDHAAQMPTCTLARIDLNVEEWSNVSENTGNLDWLIKA